MTRISLYPHEMSALVNVTVELTRIAAYNGETASEVGPKIFAALNNTIWGSPVPMLIQQADLRPADKAFWEPK